MGVNQQINRIIYDRTFTRHLCLLEYCRIDDSSFPLSDPILNRFCSKILPAIGHQIETLYLKEISIERVLQATNYPNLKNLGICDIDDDKRLISLFSDTNSLIQLSNNQISSLFINFNKKSNSSLKEVTYTFFTKILTTFTNLQCLKFNPSSSSGDGLLLGKLPETAISSTLLELHVHVFDLSDLEHILDGRFDQLRILYINIDRIATYFFNIERSENLLPNLRILSLFSGYGIHINAFNESLMPLLRRMINLEELDLYITVLCDEKFIDGDILKKDIMTHMPRLYKFTFNICSRISLYYQTTFLLNESIAKTFKYFSNNRIITCIDHFHRYSQCRIYSYPYQWKMYNNVTNNFREGLFINVTQVSLYDEHPFEHEFFFRISKSFPFMKQLIIRNMKAQQNKSNNDSRILSIIEYPNLTRLDLFGTHDDYVELFLFSMKLSLPNNLHLRAVYRSLKRVTHDFTRYMPGNNCTKLAVLNIGTVNEIDEHHLKKYFPCTYIDRTFGFFII